MHTDEKSLVAQGTAGGHLLRDLTLVVAVGAVLVLPSLFTRGLWNPDEPRYMEVAREMVALGDYVVPHLNGQVYPDKPPLFFWLAAGFYRLGFGFVSGRLVSALATLGTLLLVYAFGRARFGAKTGMLAALITATTLLFLMILKAGVIDPPLTFVETAALIGAYLALNGEGTRSRRWWLLFYAASGLAILLKGPVGIVAPGLFVLVYAVLNRKSIRAGGAMHVPGAALMLFIVGAWLVPAMVKGGEAYWRDILFHQPSTYTLKASSHVQWPHYYLAQLPLTLFPWSLFFGLALWQAVLDWRRRGDRDASFLALWFLCMLVFFSIVPAKRERYLLPTVPAVGLLCARYFMSVARQGPPWPRLHRGFAVATLCLTGALGLVLMVFPWVAPAAVTRFVETEAGMREAALRVVGAPGMKFAALTGALLLAGSILAAGRRRRALWVPGTLIALIVAGSLFTDLAVFPALDPVKCSKTFCQAIMPYMREADERYFYGNTYAGAINLYTGITSIPLIDDQDEEVRAEKLLKVLRGPGRIAVVSDEARVGPLLGLFPENVYIAAGEQIGHRSMMLLCTWGKPQEVQAGQGASPISTEAATTEGQASAGASGTSPSAAQPPPPPARR